MTSARLLVPSGGAVQASGGERSAPSQVYRVGISVTAAKAGEVRVRLTGGAPCATGLVLGACGSAGRGMMWGGKGEGAGGARATARPPGAGGGGGRPAGGGGPPPRREGVPPLAAMMKSF